MSLRSEHDLSLAARSSAPCQRGHLLSIPEVPPAKILVTRGQGLVAFLPGTSLTLLSSPLCEGTVCSWARV